MQVDADWMLNVPIFQCSNDQMFKCSNVTDPMFQYVFLFIGSQEFLVHWSIGPLVHFHIGPLVHWSIGPLVECKISNVNKVKLLWELTSGVPPVIFYFEMKSATCSKCLNAELLAANSGKCRQ